jgi:DNA transposition AAA+ family ATPase
MSNQEETTSSGFIMTKEYRRFAEFCDTCREYRYIGLCYGVPGIGKTLSARHYTHWDRVEPVLEHFYGGRSPPAEALACQTLLYTPSVVNTPRIIEKELFTLPRSLNHLQIKAGEKPQRISLMIIDEADRVKMTSLEHLRDRYDRGRFGLVLVGMPGIEKRLARYPQFYSRVGFVHQFRPLSTEEVHFILEHQWSQLGLRLQPDDFTDTEAIATIIRITGGNFRLIHRLCTQIERILRVNDVHLVTKEVVEAAREQLVIGQM